MTPQPLFDLAPYTLRIPISPFPEQAQKLLECLTAWLEPHPVNPHTVALDICSRIFANWGGYNFYVCLPHEEPVPFHIREVQVWALEALSASDLDPHRVLDLAAMVARKFWEYHGGDFVDLPKRSFHVLRDRDIARSYTGSDEEAYKLCRKYNISRRKLCKIKRQALRRSFR